VDLVSGRSTPGWDFRTLYRTRDLVEVTPERLKNTLEFFDGERLCDRCAARHGLR
jgi:hypothetical protein